MQDEALVATLQQWILPQLSPEDDGDFWSLATRVLLRDVEAELGENPSKAETYIQMGACSHWLRPHQTRWSASGGFAWPAGYGGSGDSRSGLPEFDWFVLLHRNSENNNWQVVKKLTGKRHLVFRAALPTRTVRHSQAAVNTVWFPIQPSTHKQKSCKFYGFRKIDGVWQYVTR